MESSGSSSETDVTVGPPDSTSYLRKRYSSPLKKSSKGKPDTQSPDTKSLDLGIVFRAGGEGGEEDERDPLSAGGASVERAGEEQPRSVPSFLKEVLERGHIHPTRVGLWRLQKALQDWCTPSNFINFLIVISILLLLISTASMVCRLSYVNPAFQPFIAWQPWCRLCSDCRSSAKTHPPVGGVASGGYDRIGGEREGLWTLDFFEELVKKHSSSREPPEVFDTGEQNTNT
ncbi:hypothetical protein GBAR_LOCUS2878 [Geodia barretti]|uniref:Uncharacterized protein n=2 Tax=Geodia barretti TaxID=519541 RepID=A0AA35R2D3_GEOBA|nr:hypothetical protein GBAR_LOCUS2878 [Geodia barretti]